VRSTKFNSFGAASDNLVQNSLKAGVSILALCGVLAAMPAYAQASAADDDTADSSKEIIVTGIRQSLANSQQIKKNSETVVDAISAQDIGALPDRSVTEALQRVPGVSINRFAGSNDPDHFSVEGSGVVVRGLNFVRSEFNGRDAFAAGVGGQALNFSDVPSELLGTVEVYKNTTAEMIEGGLAGTVNLNTRKPFDNNGLHIGYDAEANYGDMAKKWSPTGSLLISDTWETSNGTRIGLLADISYSRIRSRADGLQITNFQTRDNTNVRAANTVGTQVCRNPLPSDTNVALLPPGGSPCGTVGAAGIDGFADLAGTRYAPLGGQFRTQDFDRKRDGQAFAAQLETADKSALFTAQFLRSHTTNSWGEHTFETAPDLSEYNTYPVGCQQNSNGPGGSVRAECPIGGFTNYTYAPDGLFEKGYITMPGSGWRTAGSGSSSSFVPTGGQQQSLSRRQVFEENTVTDYGLNARLHLTDRLDIQLDADYTRSEKNNLDVSVFGSTFADQELDLTGDLPVIVPHKPHTLNASWASPNPALVAETDAQYFQDARVQFWRAAMDHQEHSTGEEFSFKADAAYNFSNDSFLKKLKFGARYADRSQTVRYTTYNWGAISEVWSGTPVSVQQGGLGNADFFTFPDFFRGQTPGPVGGYYYNGDLIGDYGAASTFFKSLNDIWHTTNGAGASNRWVPLAERAGTVAGTPYLPSEIQPLKQQDANAYLMASFGTETGSGMKISGNVGIRYVNTHVQSDGSIGVPSQAALGITSPFAIRCAAAPPGSAPPGTLPNTVNGVCLAGPAAYAALQQWATGVSVFDSAKNSYTEWLPSFNLKLEPTNKLVIRFAGSKVMTRPDNAYIRNFFTVGTDSSGNINASVGNPFLKPATAWQFDATAEWYFSRVGSLTLDLFYKDVSNFFFQSQIQRDITSNGVTESVLLRGPSNFSGHGKIKGFEVSYQQTFDFLPSPLNGLGVNANYTYIESKGLPNAFLNGGNLPNNSTVSPSGNMPLEGLSKHNFNITAFYEKGPISLRASYNWRSRFLLTVTDVIFPFYSIFNEPTGQLDASLFISLNSHVKIGVQGVNLLDSVTKTSQAYTGDPNVLAPRSYFMNDRRYSFILRGSF
jgi:TonB-dependent receptor